MSYYDGIKTIKTLTGKIKSSNYTCTITERWVQIFSHSFACGQGEKLTVKRSIGVETSQKESIESNIKASTGVESIISLESEIKSQVSFEINLKEYKEETREIPFESPKCARRNYVFYQLVREYNLQIDKPGSWFRSAKHRQIIFQEKTNNFYDTSYCEAEPGCKCQEKEFEEDKNLFELFINKVGILTGVKFLKDKAQLQNLNLMVTYDDVVKLISGTYKMSSKDIPEYIQYLGEIPKDTTVELQLGFDFQEGSFMNSIIAVLLPILAKNVQNTKA